jgi:hypothetical protein
MDGREKTLMDTGELNLIDVDGFLEIHAAAESRAIRVHDDRANVAIGIGSFQRLR